MRKSEECLGDFPAGTEEEVGPWLGPRELCRLTACPGRTGYRHKEFARALRGAADEGEGERRGESGSACLPRHRWEEEARAGAGKAETNGVLQRC